MHEFREEWERFGVIRHFHLLDAMAQGIDVWQAGALEDDVRTYEQATQRVMNLRSAYTGY